MKVKLYWMTLFVLMSVVAGLSFYNHFVAVNTRTIRIFDFASTEWNWQVERYDLLWSSKVNNKLMLVSAFPFSIPALFFFGDSKQYSRVGDSEYHHPYHRSKVDGIFGGIVIGILAGLCSSSCYMGVYFLLRRCVISLVLFNRTKRDL